MEQITKVGNYFGGEPLIPTRYSSKYPSDDLEKRGRRRQKSYEDELKTSYKEPPVVTDPRKSTIPFHPSDILQHPDEYNYLAEAEKKKPSIDYTSELSYDSSLYGKTSQGSTRKQPPMKHSDEHKNKNGEPLKSHRHPPPPQPVNNHSRPKRFDEKSSPKMDRKSGHGITPADENHYVNIPGSISPGTRPPYNGYKISLQDLSERSGPHSVYDPRLGDEHVPSDKPKTNGRISSDQIVDHQYDQYTSDESDYDDSGESDEELKPPALRTIAQTKRKSEPEPQNNFPPVQLRRPPKGQKTGQSITSLRGSLISPEGMSIPSTPGYENIYGNYYDDKTGKYMKGPYRGHSTGLSQERISRPRSKHSTATSQSPGYQGIAGSKHSLIISTKRRTLSGITGAHPSKHRSSSMNTLWFGDHPVPSERTLSPATPIKLSNIQIQAQAELDRRHRSSSHGHSLDRKSTYSTGITESHLSRGLSDYQGYEGIGYAYDNRGRLIHGGACLPERSASRKRRLLDGHESLSRVWIPQGEHYPVKQISNKTTGLLTNREQLQAQLDDSAMAFALRDYNLPKIRTRNALQSTRIFVTDANNKKYYNTSLKNLYSSKWSIDKYNMNLPYYPSSIIRTKSLQQMEQWNIMNSLSSKLWRSETNLYNSSNTLGSDRTSWLYLNYSTKYLHETAV
ncbi:Copper amine oxidase [Schistosoma japonicum]|nr:Copper amine oxidase [Schistosoma japonicum]